MNMLKFFGNASNKKMVEILLLAFWIQIINTLYSLDLYYTNKNKNISRNDTDYN